MHNMNLCIFNVRGYELDKVLLSVFTDLGMCFEVLEINAIFQNFIALQIYRTY